MAKLLRIRDRLLLGLAILGDVFEEVKDPAGIAGGAYSQMYGFVPSMYKKSNFYTTVSRMVTSDLIEKVIEGGEPKLRLSSGGRNHLVRDFPLTQLQKRRWDKRWRIVLFDIPETERRRRDSFREKLKELGFGMIQKSVWISPYPFEDDIRDFLEDKGLDELAFVFVADSSQLGDVQMLVNKAWEIEKMNDLYDELIVEFNSAKLSKDSANIFFEKFLELFMKDPFLPRELLPDPWWGDDAIDLMRKLVK